MCACLVQVFPRGITADAVVASIATTAIDVTITATTSGRVVSAVVTSLACRRDVVRE
jgi:hypothetical protein